MARNDKVGPRLAVQFEPVTKDNGKHRTVRRKSGMVSGDRPDLDMYRFGAVLRDGKRIAFAIEKGRWPRLGHWIEWHPENGWLEYVVNLPPLTKAAISREWIKKRAKPFPAWPVNSEAVKRSDR